MSISCAIVFLAALFVVLRVVFRLFRPLYQECGALGQFYLECILLKFDVLKSQKIHAAELELSFSLPFKHLDSKPVAGVCEKRRLLGFSHLRYWSKRLPFCVIGRP